MPWVHFTEICSRVELVNDAIVEILIITKVIVATIKEKTKLDVIASFIVM